jgi:hypothetical protein
MEIVIEIDMKTGDATTEIKGILVFSLFRDRRSSALYNY